MLLQSVAEAECRRAALEAEDCYRSSFKADDTAPEEEDLFAEHQVGGGGRGGGGVVGGGGGLLQEGVERGRERRGGRRGGVFLFALCLVWMWFFVVATFSLLSMPIPSPLSPSLLDSWRSACKG